LSEFGFDPSGFFTSLAFVVRGAVRGVDGGDFAASGLSSEILDASLGGVALRIAGFTVEVKLPRGATSGESPAAFLDVTFDDGIGSTLRCVGAIGFAVLAVAGAGAAGFVAALFATAGVADFVGATFVRAGVAAFTGPPGPTLGNREGVRADATSRTRSFADFDEVLRTKARPPADFVAPFAAADVVDCVGVLAETLRRG
jgi:hypothetical protein